MKILIIGGSGHIGSFLVKQLVDEGHNVVVVSSGRTPIDVGQFADRVELETLNYRDMLSDGSFHALLMRHKPDAVVDILQGNASGLYSACCETSVNHIVFCGSLWMFGRPKVVPTPEIKQTLCPFEDYELRYGQLLNVLKISEQDDIAVSAIMPPNICGPGKTPIDGMGGRSIEVHREHQQGKEVFLPYPGTNLIGPCDADDVARGFTCALNNREASAGDLFNVGPAYSLTSEQFINTYADIYGTSISIRYVEPQEYIRDISPDLGAHFHFLEHMCPDISKISSRLGYKPKYTPEETMERAVRWMQDQKLLGQATSGCKADMP
ncbi:MAG: NAD-dependent epimerase/dehydratase family protein [Armatimonadota bacterium]